MKHFLLLCLAISLAACSPTVTATNAPAAETRAELPQPEVGLTQLPATGTPANPSGLFNQEQRLITDQIISIFENDTPEIQYGYAETLGDGRGITAGRAGFTSATGDLLEVVQRYTARVPDNPLAPYLPRLEQLAANWDDSLQGLGGLEADWALAADDPAFRTVQDEVVDDFYYLPATQHFEALGARYPITLLNLYDAIIQHGDGEDPDGLPALIARTTQHLGGAPADGVDELAWLAEFLDVRRRVLLNARDPGTRQAWAESLGRLDALVSIFESGNYALTPPIVINPWGDAHTLPVE